MKRWLSKYWMCHGVEEVNGEPVANRVIRAYNEPEDPTPPKYARWGTMGFDRIGTDIHYTREQAVEAANKKRLRKIESLKKALKKLETPIT